MTKLTNWDFCLTKAAKNRDKKLAKRRGRTYKNTLLMLILCSFLVNGLRKLTGTYILKFLRIKNSIEFYHLAEKGQILPQVIAQW